MDADGCELCAREATDAEPAGGWVVRTAWWSACVAPGFDVPGWLFLELRRHAEGPMGMDDDEAGELGILIRQLSSAIERVTGAERVYVVAYGELFPHFHVLLSPRLPGAPPQFRGPSLFGHGDELRDPAAAAETAVRIREALSVTGDA
jgi:diadenosine tetraphosphate (Ap4A) HIT family hydrolase